MVFIGVDLSMTIYEFAKLNKSEKATTTWTGTLLAHREKDEIKYALYAVADFFVEVSYNVANNEISDFRPSKTKRLLEEYLSDIKIGTLI